MNCCRSLRIVPWTSLCIVIIHTLPSVGALVQMMLSLIVIVGQLPQFDVLIKYCSVEQFETDMLQSMTKLDCEQI